MQSIRYASIGTHNEQTCGKGVTHGHNFTFRSAKPFATGAISIQQPSSWTNSSNQHRELRLPASGPYSY